MRPGKFWLVPIVSRLVKAIGYLPHQRFERALANPKASQDIVFRKRVEELSRTEYGRCHGITKRSTYEEFAATIPVQDYDGFSPWLAKQLACVAKPIITPGRIIHIEPTSGSSGKSKRIPFTGSLMRMFSTLFCIWAYDQLSNGFCPKTGRIFISISPASDAGALDHDGEFLVEPLRSLLKPFLLLPPKPESEDAFQHELAMALLSAKDLEIISVWSPSYLLVLLDYIDQNRDALKACLPKPLHACFALPKINWETVWPDLKLISCWDNALAEPLAERLRELFPNVNVQGKGLLATEAPVTVPLIGAGGCLPMLRDVFFEFESSDGKIKRLHELGDGEQIQVILTQSGGLTRYRLNDVVRVDGFYRGTPKLVFVGRVGQVCDLAGEKLHEVFVRDALLPLIPSGRFILVPDSGIRAGYVLVAEQESELLAQQADDALAAAYHYRYARSTGQLQPLAVHMVKQLLPELLAFHQSEGVKLGNIKDMALVTDPEKGKRLLAFLNLASCTRQQPSLSA